VGINGVNGDAVCALGGLQATQREGDAACASTGRRRNAVCIELCIGGTAGGRRGVCIECGNVEDVVYTWRRV